MSVLLRKKCENTYRADYNYDKNHFYSYGYTKDEALSVLKKEVASFIEDMENDIDASISNYEYRDESKVER